MNKLIFVMLIMMSGWCHASEVIPEDKAILAAIGEAESQGYEGLLAVCCAIRNRGTLQGVYGLNAPRVKRGLYTKGTWLLARKAWRESYQLINEPRCLTFKGKALCHSADPVIGSNAWENTSAFGKPSWADSCEETVTIKDHVFFRCPTPKRKV